MARCIAIANQKGGVGKTTTAVNLSACLGERGKKVLVVDIDPQGNTGSGLGINKKKLKKTAYDVLVGGEPMEKVLWKTPYKNLTLCPSSIDLAGAEIDLITAEDRLQKVKKAVRTVAEDYDYIIIDCPPSLGILTLNGLVAADSVLVPIQCEFFALEGLSQITDTIRKIKNGHNPNLELEGVLLTMYDGRTNLSMQVAAEVKKYFPKNTFSTAIPRNVRLGEAPSFGQPITIYDPRSKGAEAYFDVADEVIENNG